ncbi:hypothetical protein F4802DRAFT_415232 [Xylaria palmicola]|nr:hypothetical protein F4802DRAFT_415232 [Xylaria palmicola]
MHVYTAHVSHVSHALLDRFQYLNQPPTATEPLIRLDHRRVPYEPQATFRHRLLAAVSVTAIVEEPNPEDYRCRKRALSPHGEIVSPKRRRSSECPREPLTSLDVNLERHSQLPCNDLRMASRTNQGLPSSYVYLERRPIEELDTEPIPDEIVRNK